MWLWLKLKKKTGSKSTLCELLCWVNTFLLSYQENEKRRMKNVISDFSNVLQVTGKPGFLFFFMIRLKEDFKNWPKSGPQIWCVFTYPFLCEDFVDFLIIYEAKSKVGPG